MAWTRVQSAGNVDTSGSGNNPVSLTSVAVGDLLVAAITNYDAEIGSIGDTVNTWHKIASKENVANIFYTDLWYTIVTTGGSLTITGTTQAFSGLAVVEFNPNGTITVDGTAATASGTSTSPASGNVTITTPDLAVGAFGLGNGAPYTWSNSGSFTVDSGSAASYVSGSHYGVAIGYNLDANASPTDPTLTLSNALAVWAAVGIGFLATPFVLTVTGPSSGINGTASTNFTVTPAGIDTDTVTFSDGGHGGTFTPSSLTFSASSAAQTFTYTPTIAGSITLTLTSGNGATVTGSPLTYTVTSSTSVAACIMVGM